MSILNQGDKAVDNCIPYQRSQRQRGQRAFTEIASPNVGDELSVRSNGRVKGLVCRARNIIACLASGDVVHISWPENQFGIWKRRLGLSESSIQAICKCEGDVRDSFVLGNGRVINFNDDTLNRNVSIRVLSVAPRDHVHEAPAYNEDRVRGLIDSAPLPVYAETRCPVHA